MTLASRVEQPATVTASHAAAAVPSQAQQQETRERLTTYLQELGIHDPDCLTALSQQLLQQALLRPDAAEHLTAVAIEEVRQRLDNWLGGVLQLESADPLRQQAAARAALRFAHESPSWPVGLLQSPPAPPDLVRALRAAAMPPLPPQQELTMPTQRIDFWHPLMGALGRLFARFRRSA